MKNSQNYLDSAGGNLTFFGGAGGRIIGITGEIVLFNMHIREAAKGGGRGWTTKKKEKLNIFC